MELNITGGSTIGMASATWPFASLKISKEKLEFRTSKVGTLIFLPKDIISIERYDKFGVLGRGLKINHRVPNYNQVIIFWSFKHPDKLLSKIEKTGFLNNINSKITQDERIVIEQQSNDFPLKDSVVYTVIAIWICLFALDSIKFIPSEKIRRPFGIFSAFALFLVFSISILTLISKDFARLILKKGRTINDINNLLYLFSFVTGVMLAAIFVI